MFCPKCGDVLRDEPGQPLKCIRGDMPLSADLEVRLRDWCAADATGQAQVAYPFRVGGEWYCPACGTGTVEEPTGNVCCPKCRRPLREFIYPLIELHPHRVSDGKWR